MFGDTNHGSVIKTADSVIGVSGKPCRVFSVSWLSDGTARDLVLRNGTTASDTIYVTLAGSANVSIVQNWEGGLLFPDGCFLDFTASMVNAVIEFRSELV